MRRARAEWKDVLERLRIQARIAGTNSGHLQYLVGIGFSFRPIPAGGRPAARPVMIPSIMFSTPDEIEKLSDMRRHSLSHGGTRRSVDKDEEG
jgi:hypothetical protein